MREQTLEYIIDNFTEHEIRDLCFVINQFGNRRRGGGVYADEYSVKFYTRRYAEDCIQTALDSNNLTAEGAFYIQKLQIKMESL
jgi:hypothetical protein